MKITMKTENGKWTVKADHKTYIFTNSDEAFRFVEVCRKGVI